MISSSITRVSALLLLLGGLALLFAADDILPRLVSGFPPQAAWLGQLLGAAWLGAAALNWFSRSTLLGGIYGRPVVMLNTTLYFVSTMVLLEAARATAGSIAVPLAAAPFVMLAVAYGWLLFRGPFERDMETHRNRGSS